MALVFACLAFTPSFVPRIGPFQGFVCAVAAAGGYGLGVLGAWLWRTLADRAPRPTRRPAWRRFGITAAVALACSFLLGQHLQRKLRALMGMPEEGLLSILLMPLVAAAVLLVLLFAGRGIAWTSRRLGGWLGRRMGGRAARVLGGMTVVVVTALAASGIFWDVLIDSADGLLALKDLTTAEGAVQPRTPLRSGSSASLVPWDSLGYQGRNFIGKGPSASEIASLTGAAAKEPIRAYAGTASAPDEEGRAALAVRDLERAGGFERAHLLVVNTTGSGWVVPQAAAAFEYMTGGDCAIIAMQYSHLPSWMSDLVDRERARDAGRELFDAVFERWSRLPVEERPKLLVFGESLGSFATEAGFSGEADLASRTDGVLLVGPPAINPLHRRFTDRRDPGSPEVEPVYRGGRTVRFSRRPGQDIPPTSEPWSGTRVLYLQHPSDPFLWWSPRLLLRRPEGMREVHGQDVLPELVWIPLVTFLQVTADLAVAMDVPPGYGHVYTGEHVDGWRAILQPPGWTDAMNAQLRERVLSIPR